MRVCRSLARKALDRRARIDHFWRVDANRPDPLDPAVLQSNVDGVTIDDVGDGRRRDGCLGSLG